MLRFNRARLVYPAGVCVLAQPTDHASAPTNNSAVLTMWALFDPPNSVQGAEVWTVPLGVIDGLL